MKAIRTELSLTRDEFDSYNVGVDAELTFCLKEFRVCVVFAELCFATFFHQLCILSPCYLCCGLILDDKMAKSLKIHLFSQDIEATSKKLVET